MFTPTNDRDEPISFMDPYSSLLSPFTYYEMDGYVLNHYYYYHGESLSAGESIAQPFAESSNEPISASSKMKDHVSQGDINGIVEQDNSRNNHASIKQTSRKRPTKGDRHSKIPTAQGLRDRRMRLSLDVARQFFQLQDMLSYDKPSQTVKWLLLQAEPAIDKLKETKLRPNCGKNSPSATSEGVVGSTAYENIVCDMPKVKVSQEKSKRKRKNAFNPAAKELRKKARERAKERTQTKKQASMLNDPGRCVDEVLGHHQCHVRPIVALQIEDDSSSPSPNMRPSLDVLYKTEQLIQDVSIPFGTPEDFAGTSLVHGNANWSQIMSLNYHQEDQTCHGKPLPEFQFHGGSWEHYNHPHV